MKKLLIALAFSLLSADTVYHSFYGCYVDIPSPHPIQGQGIDDTCENLCQGLPSHVNGFTVTLYLYRVLYLNNVG